MRSERSAHARRSERGLVRAEAAAALIFDPEQSAFVWANAAGLSLFGVKSIARLAQDRLDRALPAASRLVAFVDGETEAPAEMALDFWTPRGPVRLTAVVERLALSRERIGVLIRAGGVAIDKQRAEAILRSVAPVPPPEPLPEAPAVALPEIEAQCRHSLEISQEDAETLREIARLIRQGELSRLPDPSSFAPESQEGSQLRIAPEPAPGPVADVLPPMIGPLAVGPTVAPPLAAPKALAGTIPGLDFDGEAMRLLTEVAHELRTPLTAVRGYGELIAARPDDAKVGDRARHIVSAADHALALIADILDARRIATGTAELVFTDVDLGEELAAIATMVAPQASAAGVSIEVECPAGLPKVVADARRVRQVLLNVTGNAIKFTAGGGRVRLSGHYAADGTVEILVSDTGRGMASEEADALLHVSAPRRSRGIGLPLSRTLAEANGARLTIDSEVGVGTTVRLAFPSSCVVPP